jgi:hypothetical protein
MPALCRVMILFCGQGMTTTVEVYNDGVVKPFADYLALVDCGGTGEGGDHAADYVAQKIIDSGKFLHLLVISHQDGDHVKLLEKVKKKLVNKGVVVEKVFLGGNNWSKSNKATVNDFLEAMDVGEDDIEFDSPYLSHYKKIATPSKLKYIDDFKGMRIRVLVSGLKTTGSSDIVRNASSAVLVVDYGTSCMVLPGDATHQTFAAVNSILSVKNLLPKVAGFEIPHHGALRTAVENYYARGQIDDFDWTEIKTFAAYLETQEVLASAGPRNSHRHPVEEVINVFEGNLVKADSHRYTAWVFDRKGGTRSEGWINFKNVTKAEHSTVTQVDFDNGSFWWGDLSVDLAAPGVLRPDEVVTFHPRGTFVVEEGPEGDRVVYAPAP